MPILNRKSFNSERNDLTVNSLFLEFTVIKELNRLKVNLNKPFYIGFSILDISKIIIYDFNYNYMKKIF